MRARWLPTHRRILALSADLDTAGILPARTPVCPPAPLRFPDCPGSATPVERKRRLIDETLGTGLRRSAAPFGWPLEPAGDTLSRPTRSGREMSSTLLTTKLIVHDLEMTAAFYCDAYGFERTGRIQAEIAGEPIDEILLGRPGGPGSGLILMKYVDRPAPRNGEVVLVFSTDDLEALFARVRGAGGGIYVEPYQSETTDFKVGFSTDPEGHLIENLEIPG